MWKKLHDRIATSEKHAQLGFGPFALWTMMLPHTDTKGRYLANPAFIKGQCLPFFEEVRLVHVSEALQTLESVGLVHLYDSGSKKYLVLHDADDWNATGGLKYQRPKWPEPPPGLCECLSRRDSSVTTLPGWTVDCGLAKVSPELASAADGLAQGAEIRDVTGRRDDLARASAKRPRSPRVPKSNLHARSRPRGRSTRARIRTDSVLGRGGAGRGEVKSEVKSD